MNNKKLVKLLGAFFIIVSILQLILNAHNNWLSLTDLFRPYSLRSLKEYLFLSLFFSFALPIATLIAGFGILKIRTWGWWLAMMSCIITFIANSYGAINFAIACYKFQNTTIPTVPEGAHIEFFSMWPTYMHAIVSALLILLLKQKSVKIALSSQR